MPTKTKQNVTGTRAELMSFAAANGLLFLTAVFLCSETVQWYVFHSCTKCDCQMFEKRKRHGLERERHLKRNKNKIINEKIQLLMHFGQFTLGRSGGKAKLQPNCQDRVSVVKKYSLSFPTFTLIFFHNLWGLLTKRRPSWMKCFTFVLLRITLGE